MTTCSCYSRQHSILMQKGLTTAPGGYVGSDYGLEVTVIFDNINTLDNNAMKI